MEKNKPIKKQSAPERYYEAVGRRKTSVARVRLFPVKGKQEITVNDKEFKKYFSVKESQNLIEEPLKKTKVPEKFSVSVKISGGGMHSQAEALRHGISRALVNFKQEFRTNLKKAGFLKRDPRMKERRKFGLKKARKAPQWSKR